MIGRRIVLFVLTSWLALPALSLACALSCLPPAQAAVAHCHESSGSDGMAPDSAAALRAGHQCADHAPFTVTATTVHRYAAPAPVLPIIVALVATDSDISRATGLANPASASSPPARPIIPLRL